MSAPDVVSNPGAGGLGPGLGSHSYELREAGLPQEAAPNASSPLLCCVSGCLVGLLVYLDPCIGRCPPDRALPRS